MDILQGILHRMTLLEETHADLNDDQGRLRWNTEELDEKISDELAIIKKETKGILEECEKIRKHVFDIGSLLQEKVSKRELEDFEKELQDWPLEDFITKKELEPTFSRYAK